MQFTRVTIALTSLFAMLLPVVAVNADSSQLEIISISEVADTSVEILFKSSVPKKSLANYVITAAVDPSVGQAKNIKKIIKTKATGLITAEIKNLNPKVAYKFSVSAKTNKAKMISSEVVEYSSLSNLMDVLSNLPADWGNPKPTSAPLVAPAFTLSSSSETRTVNTAATGFTVSSTGGAIASFAINATPPGMSFNTSTGALTGTPNTIAAATNYTITATNASGSATQTFTLTVTVTAPAFTISSASETKASGSAITGYTISSTGGAIASYAISPAAPAGLTFNTSTGLLSGTPTTVAGATAYTITATNASGSATQTFTLTVTAVVYTVGQTGPGGGKIFYVAATPFACGPTMSSSCTYLEAAPTSGTSAWTDVNRTWSTGANQSVSVPNANGTAIGTGYKNSLAIVAQAGNVATSSAAVAARGYGGPNNLTDWYLPSKDELNQLYLQRTTVGGFVADFYWASSEYNTEAANAWVQGFSDGLQGFGGKGHPGGLYVRPVRAF